MVGIELVRTGTKIVRIAKLPPEVPDNMIRSVLSHYEEVKEVQEETWSRADRYPMANGI
jgi:hypothetical protein